MALQKIKAFMATCDNCKEIYMDGNEYSIFVDIDFLKEDLPDSEWANEGGELLCPNCTTLDEEIDSINDLKVLNDEKTSSRSMTVNFNNLRKQLQNVHNETISILNQAIEDEKLDVFVGENLEITLTKMHNLIVGLMCSFQEGDDSMKDLSDEIDLKTFNPYKDEIDEDS